MDDLVPRDVAGNVISSLRAMLKKHETAMDTWNINGLIDEVLVIAKSELLFNNTAVEFKPVPDLPLVYGDRVQIQQVLLNLIINAVDAMDNTPAMNSIVAIKAERQNDQKIVISVRDSGKGIGEGELENIFNPLYTTKSDGLGMGLSICKTIVTNQNGRLWAENNPDQGATFHFTLPVDIRGE